MQAHKGVFIGRFEPGLSPYSPTQQMEGHVEVAGSGAGEFLKEKKVQAGSCMPWHFGIE